MKYTLIDENRSRSTVGKMAEILGVKAGGYYSWKNRKPTPHTLWRRKLEQMVFQIFYESRETYGSPRITETLQKRGFSASENTVAYVMRKLGLKAKAGRKFKVTTDSDHPLHPSPNRLKQQFAVKKPNAVWVSDITYIWTRQGWFYLCVIIDLFSRKVVGWQTSDTLKHEMVIQALNKAYLQRKPEPGLIFHSDRGRQFASVAFREQLKLFKMKQSMSRKGNCWDNAPAESFFHTIKTEELNWTIYANRDEAQAALFRYIEMFYNRLRIHSGISYATPEELERSWKKDIMRLAA